MRPNKEVLKDQKLLQKISNAVRWAWAWETEDRCKDAETYWSIDYSSLLCRMLCADFLQPHILTMVLIVNFESNAHL